MPHQLLELYQAEWCPYSHRVRERLTELGVPFIARQVAPERDAREELRRVAGTEEIPTLLLGDGHAISDTDEIIAHLDEHYDEPADADGHREQAAAHQL